MKLAKHAHVESTRASGFTPTVGPSCPQRRVTVAPLSLGHRHSVACWRALEAASLSPKLTTASAEAVAAAAARCVLDFADSEAPGRDAGKRGHGLSAEAIEAIAVSAAEALLAGLAVTGEGRESAAAAFSAAAGGAVGVAASFARPIALAQAASTAARAFALACVCWSCEPSVAESVRQLRVGGSSPFQGAGTLVRRITQTAGLNWDSPEEGSGSAPAGAPNERPVQACVSWGGVAGDHTVAALLLLLALLCSGGANDDVPDWLEGAHD